MMLPWWILCFLDHPIATVPYYTTPVLIEPIRFGPR